MKICLSGLLMVASISLTSVHAGEFNSAPWFSPTTLPLKAEPEEDFNFMLFGGAGFAHGKGRVNFFSVDPWSKGWISRLPHIELGFSYSPDRKFQFGFQVPLLILSSTFNFHYALNKYFATGAKLGLFSSLYATASWESKDHWFFSFSPALGINQFGLAEGSTESTSPLTKIDESRFTAGGQIAIGNHFNPMDLALVVGYDYALGGEGIENSFIFDDVLMRHFLRAGVAMVF